MTPSEVVPAASLRHIAFWSLAGNVTYALCQWCLLVVIARAGTTHQVGLFALALAFTAPVMLCANLQLRSLLATDAKQEYRIGHYLAVRLVTVVLALSAIATLAFSLNGGEARWAIIAMAVAKAIEALSEIVYGLLQRQERMRAIATSLAIKGVAGLAGMWLALLATGDVAIGILAMAAAWAIALLAYDLPQASRLVTLGELRPVWERSLLLRLLRAAGPMGLVALLLSLNANLPCFFIDGHLGTAELGRFAALSYLLAAGNLVIMALGNALSPRLADQYAAGRRNEYRALLGRMLLLCLAVGVAAVAASAIIGRFVLALVYGNSYGDFADVLVLLTIGVAITWVASVLGFAVTAARQLTIQLPIVAVSTLACLFANAWLVPTHGLIGAAWSSIIMASALTAGYVVVAVRAIRAPSSIAKHGE